jgi:hypothetical protein
MAFAFSGFQVLHLGHPNAVAIVAHIPWLLAALDAAVSANARTRAIGAAGLSLLTGSEILLGYPQYVYLSALTCAIYVVVKRPPLRASGCRLWQVWSASPSVPSNCFPPPTCWRTSERATTTPGFRSRGRCIR